MKNNLLACVLIGLLLNIGVQVSIAQNRSSLNPEQITALKNVRNDLSDHLTKELIPFWTKNSIDKKYGGYFTCFDKDGQLYAPDSSKYLNTQARLIWSFSTFYKMYPENKSYLQAAKQGVDFFIDHFWDKKNAGWYWKVARNGDFVDNGKVVYGQSFAIYALTEYYMATGDQRGLDYAEKTFETLQKYAADVARGGYYENLENDWSLSAPGFCAGDRKSLDIHMHMMECYTNLYKATKDDVHKRRLEEVILVLKSHMINKVTGCGMNQFDLNFNPIPAIAIRRTYNAEREGKLVETPTNTTSYGHNLELLWLMSWANQTMEKPDTTDISIFRRLADHSLKYGLDYEFGGVYRDGPQDGPALIKDKEFWQNAEAMVGYLEIYRITKDPKYLEAFNLVWKFVNTKMINHKVGEWTILLTREGKPIDPNVASVWKVSYHSGRAVIESINRIDRILKEMK